MKANDAPDQDHRHDIDDFINACPPQRTEQ